MFINNHVILNVAYCAFEQSAVSDFFYWIKIQLRGHHFNQIFKEIWLEENKVSNRPKRRKFKDNPYTIIEIEISNKYLVTFKDGNGIFNKVEVSKDIYELFNYYELRDLSQMNEYDNHEISYLRKFIHIIQLLYYQRIHIHMKIVIGKIY